MLGILSGLISVIFGVITYFSTRQEQRRKRRIFLAVFLPIQFFFTIYFLGLGGAVLVSEFKGVDIGIGDSFYVPVNSSCQIRMIDVTDKAYLICSDEQIINEITQINSEEDLVFGQTAHDKFFSYNAGSQHLRRYSNYGEMVEIEKRPNLQLTEISDYYHKRRNEVAGTAITIVGLLALAVTVALVWLTRTIVMKIGK
ncbi:hypothetical protein [Fulvivirga ligni]|uniref:hypothetical protein n=1 Tax=Fulvivirga ligni TaxID=2904246 RepID=UPI001F29B91D|nr:hypothetical protein [Fulvivirga ligni]UII20516.1 hypothetical protein LVD16_22000 [Fulvivirga ligni]